MSYQIVLEWGEDNRQEAVFDKKNEAVDIVAGYVMSMMPDNVGWFQREYIMWKLFHALAGGGSVKIDDDIYLWVEKV